MTLELKGVTKVVGAETHIRTIPGYLPLNCMPELNEVFRANALAMLPGECVVDSGHFGGSTDMGDVSHLLPSIHPFTGGVCGALHTKEFNAVDYGFACVQPAKLMAKLRTHHTGNQTLLLKTNMAAGHSGASGRYEALKETAFKQAFLLKALGLEQP